MLRKPLSGFLFGVSAFFGLATLFAQGPDHRLFGQILKVPNKTVVDYFLLCPDLSLITGLVNDPGNRNDPDEQVDERKALLGLFDDENADPDESNQIARALTEVSSVVIDIPNAFIQVKGESEGYGYFTLTFAYYERADKSRVPGWSIVTDRDRSSSYGTSYRHRFYDIGDGTSGAWKALGESILPTPGLSYFTKDPAVSKLPAVWDVDIPRYGTVTSLIPRPLSKEGFVNAGGSRDSGAYTRYLARITLLMKNALQTSWDKSGARFTPTRTVARSDASIVAGDSDGKTATVWREGVLVDLPTPSGYKSAFATGVAVDGNVELVAGSADMGAGNPVPVLWRDGQAEILPLPPSVSGISFASPQIVAEGGEVDIVANSNTNPVLPLFWKNSMVTVLPSPAGEGMARGIIRDKGNVWIGGSVSSSSGRISQAAYWQNGTLHVLPVPDSSSNSELTGIAVSDKGVVFCGYNDAKDYYRTPAALLWDTTGSSVALPTVDPAKKAGDQSDNIPVGLSFNGKNISYLSGSGSGQLLWENGKVHRISADNDPYNLPVPELTAYRGSELVIAGYSAGNDNQDGGTRAEIWRDDGQTISPLDLGQHDYTRAFTIFVTKAKQ